jgi:class 3 adenylate cyclase
MMVLTFIISIPRTIIAKTNYKNKMYSAIIFLAGIIGGLNDFSVSHGLIKKPMITEYLFFIFIFYIFLHFLNEDNNSFKKMQTLTEDLKNERDEANRRLKITEIYTRKSLVEIIKAGENPIGYEPKNINNAVMFNDIRDFTSFSESMTPLDTVNFLNAYFNRVNEVIINNNGEIDKLIGDCIMAGFQNPDDAVRTSIKIRLKLIDYNRERISNGHSKINTGIGITYGPVIIGNIGSQSKMDYTLIGDTVNTASRIEALTKYYKAGIIISEDVVNVLNNNYDMRFLDLVQVKGKKEPIKIFEIYDYYPEKIKKIIKEIQHELDTSFQLYRKGNLRDAHAIYSKLINQIGPHTYDNSSCIDPVINFYKQRCMNISRQIKSGLISKKDWHGIYEFIDK